MTNREIRDYKVDVGIKGTMPRPDTGESMDVDTSMSFKIRHRYIKRDRDGLLPMEVTMLEGVVTLDGQKITITPSIYPKFTVLLDKNFRIDDVFGYSECTPNALPGHQLRQYDHAHSISRARARPGLWAIRGTPISSCPRSNRLTIVNNTLKSASKPEITPATVTVKQDITRVSMPNSTTPPPSMKATAQSTFTQDTGKLTLPCRMRSNHAAAPVAPKDPKSKQAPAI